MPSRKLKTHKGVKKRFKVSATGKVGHKPCGSSHLNSHKSGSKIRRLRRRKYLKVSAETHRLRLAVRAKPVSVPAGGTEMIPQLHPGGEEVGGGAVGAGPESPAPAEG